MQEYEMLLEDVVAQLKAGFVGMERRHQGEIAKLQQGHKEEIEGIHHCYDDKIAQIILDLELGEVNKKELNDVLNNISF